jgi:hypothetical protein
VTYRAMEPTLGGLGVSDSPLGGPPLHAFGRGDQKMARRLLPENLGRNFCRVGQTGAAGTLPGRPGVAAGCNMSRSIELPRLRRPDIGMVCMDRDA